MGTVRYDDEPRNPADEAYDKRMRAAISDAWIQETRAVFWRLFRVARLSVHADQTLNPDPPDLRAKCCASYRLVTLLHHLIDDLFKQGPK
jgi:hypothetical protein